MFKLDGYYARFGMFALQNLASAITGSSRLTRMSVYTTERLKVTSAYMDLS